MTRQDAILAASILTLAATALFLARPMLGIG